VLPKEQRCHRVYWRNRYVIEMATAKKRNEAKGEVKKREGELW